MSDPYEEAQEARRNAVHKAGKASVELSLTDGVFTGLREALVERWASTGIEQTATREKMFVAVQTIDTVRRALFEAVQNGKIEAHAQAQAELLSPAQADRLR